MENYVKLLSAMAAMNHGAALTDLPVEIVAKFAQIQQNFDPKNHAILSILEVSYCVGSAIGCLSSASYTQRFGFIESLMVLWILSAVINIFLTIPWHWIFTSVMRFLNGFFASSISSLAPLLVAEMLDPIQRGKTIMVFSIVLNFAVLLSYMVHYFISFNYNFYYFTFLPPLLLSCVGFFATVQTRKLKQIRRKQHIADNNTIINTEEFYGDVINANVSAQHLQLSQTFISTHQEENTQVFEQKQELQGVNFKLTRTQFTRILYVTIALGMMQMFTGVDAIVIYASDIFGGVFKHPKSGILGSILLAVVNFAYTFVAAPFAERKKRRLMLTIGVVGCAICSFCIGLVYLLKGPHYMVMILMLVFFLFYNLGPEPMVFMLFSELFPEKYKVRLNGVGYTVNWIANIFTVFAFDFFADGLEYIVYWTMGLLTVILGISGTFLAPETFQRELIDIEKEIRSWTKHKRVKLGKASTEVSVSKGTIIANEKPTGQSHLDDGLTLSD